MGATAAQGVGGANPFDQWLFSAWNGLAGRSVLADAIAVLGAQYAIFAVAGILIVLFFALPRGPLTARRHLAYAGLAALLALGVNYVISSIFYVPRPFVFEPRLVHLLVQHARDSSFPSDHAAAAVAVAFAVRGLGRGWRGVFWLLAVLIVLSRVFVGVHWPSDVLGGGVVGLLSAATVLALRGFLARPVDRLLGLLRLDVGRRGTTDRA